MTDDGSSAERDVLAAKSELRVAMRRRRADVVADGSAPRRSAAVMGHLLELDAIRSARRIVAYRSLPTEVDTSALIDWCGRNEIELVLPDQRSHAPFPVAARWADVIVVPAVAVTPDGRRLGQGGGWYDHFLTGRRSDCPAIGIVFLPQIVGDLPVEPHDVRLDCVVSEDGASWAE